jgi:UDP-N-acetylenolpyruvoylglucosamine reductase
LAKFMNYDVIIITEADFSDDPAFVYPFRRRVLETSGVALEWEIKRIGVALRSDS